MDCILDLPCAGIVCGAAWEVAVAVISIPKSLGEYGDFTVNDKPLTMEDLNELAFQIRLLQEIVQLIEITGAKPEDIQAWTWPGALKETRIAYQGHDIPIIEHPWMIERQVIVMYEKARQKTLLGRLVPWY